MSGAAKAPYNEAAAELDLRASVEAKAMLKVIVGLKATAEDQDCFEAKG